jgi:hypothetical protein
MSWYWRLSAIRSIHPHVVLPAMVVQEAAMLRMCRSNARLFMPNGVSMR